MKSIDKLNLCENSASRKKFSYSLLAICLIVVSSLSIMFVQKDYAVPNKVIYYDVLHYYSYLPAIFIEKDYTMSFLLDEKGNYREEEYGKKYWPSTAENGNFVFKTSMGMAFCYAPFFFIANVVANISDSYQADGFSTPYALALSLSCIAFLLFGLIFLRKLLLKYFSDMVSAITLLIIVLTTNMFWYTWSFESPMSHVYSFAFVAMFLYFTDKWFEKQNWKYTICLGLSFGMISLLRPSNAIIAIVFVLYGVNSLSSFKKRIILFLKNYKYIIGIILAIFIVWMPQFIYWKTITGEFIYFSYGDERFFFDNPFIIQGLFGFKTGWLVYSPIMIFSLIGLFFINKKIKGLLLPICVFFIINVYIIFYWWSWWYGGGFGVRPLIDCYALLALPLAAFLDWVLKSKRKIRVPILIVVVIIALQSAFHTYQHSLGVLHHSDMTREAYIECFWKLHKPADFYSLLNTIDDNEAKKGNR